MPSVPIPKVRRARIGDRDAIEALIAASSKSLVAQYYREDLVDAALQGLLGVDTRLIQDGTYFVAKLGDRIVGCGGWSRRKTLFGSDAACDRDDSFIDPRKEAAKIRAFFVHPEHARQGIATRILQRCEREALKRGFHRLALGATLSGVAFYRANGYRSGAPYEFEFAPGRNMTIVPMNKTIRS